MSAGREGGSREWGSGRRREGGCEKVKRDCSNIRRLMAQGRLQRRGEGEGGNGVGKDRCGRKLKGICSSIRYLS